MARLFSWLAGWLATMRGLKAGVQKALEESIKADVLVASAVMEAEAHYEADRYCQELEANGQQALAAEIRKRLGAFSASPSMQVLGGPAGTPERGLELAGPAPKRLAGPVPAPKALPAPAAQKPKRGRPRKNPMEPAAQPSKESESPVSDARF